MSTQVSESDLAVGAKTKRILAFDLIRGWLLVMIMIDHVELYPSILDFFTGKGRLFVSAAEGFFFLSGLLIGIVYRRRLALGMKVIVAKLWRRGLELWIGSIILTLLYVTIAVYIHDPGIKYGIQEPVNWPHILKETILLRYSYGWSDFLARFAILMAFAPLVFWLIAKGKWWLMLIASILVWHFRGQGFTTSWQIIFNSGILVGFYWQQLVKRLTDLKPTVQNRLKQGVYATAAVTFAVSYLSVYLLQSLNDHYGSLTPWLRHLTFTWNNYNADVWVYAQKWTMGPLRIVLFFLWFSALFMLVNKYQRRINQRTRGVLELLGRNSLFVYIAHSFIVFVFKIFIPVKTTLWQNFLITLAALVLLIAVTIIYKAFTSGSGYSRPDRWAQRLSEKYRWLGPLANAAR